MTLFDILTHLFVPQESNNQRPKILHPQAFLFYIIFLLFIGTGLRTVYRFAPNILGVATNISVTDLLSSTNEKRVQSGLAPLTLNSELSQAAYDKAEDMFGNNYWAHFSPNGKSPWDFIVASGYQYTLAGENLAKDFNNSTDVVNAWLSSPSHRDNLLKPEYRDIGFAVVNGTLNGEETTLVVQMFGTTPGNLTTEVKTNVPVEIIPQPPVISPLVTPEVIVAGVKTSPSFDLVKVNKSLSLLLLSLLTIILTLDGFLIWQKKTIRISGHNVAHVIFFAALITAVWLTGSGSIL